MNKTTKIICIECEREIKRDEGFILLKFRIGKHYPDCLHPLESNKVRMYEPNEKRREKDFRLLGYDYM